MPPRRPPVSYGATNTDATQAFGIACLGAREKEVEQPSHLRHTFEKRQLGYVTIVLHEDGLLIYLIFSLRKKEEGRNKGVR